MTKPMHLIALVAAAAAATSGCASVRQAVGAEKIVPDEFRVVTRAPLVVPPDYALRPPRPGDPRPQELRPDGEARAALFGQDVGAEASEAERLLVARAGADAVDPTIRDQVDFEGANIVHRDQGFADRVLSFGRADAPADVAVDPAEEARRLAEAESVRRVTGGGPVVIQRDEGGIRLPGL
jgi:hypothetical protein